MRCSCSCIGAEKMLQSIAAVRCDTAHLDDSQFDGMRGPCLSQHCDHPCSNSSSTVTAITARRALVLPEVAVTLEWYVRLLCLFGSKYKQRSICLKMLQIMDGSNNLGSQASEQKWYDLAQVGPLLGVPCQKKQKKAAALHG